MRPRVQVLMLGSGVILAMGVGGCGESPSVDEGADLPPSQVEANELVAHSDDVVLIRVRGEVVSSGTVFIDAWEAPLTMSLDDPNAIVGLREGVVGMRAGEQRELHIPGDRGYGVQGRGALIPPNAALRIEVELVQIVREP
ncbi:MAG: FKBP-type peptidyl-prolyl cis-trans isomerase [Planctomycetota bacterium]